MPWSDMFWFGLFNTACRTATSNATTSGGSESEGGTMMYHVQTVHRPEHGNCYPMLPPKTHPLSARTVFRKRFLSKQSPIA